MFAEFELITHESLEKGNPLTSKDLCKIWHELNEKYFGLARGAVEVDLVCLAVAGNG